MIILEIQESLLNPTSRAPHLEFDASFHESSSGIEAVVLYGPPQAGKSTMVCQLKQSEDAPCPEVARICWTKSFISFWAQDRGRQQSRLFFRLGDWNGRLAMEAETP